MKNKCLPILRIIPNANNLVERIRISRNACLYDLVLFRNELKDREIEIPIMNINQGKTKSVTVNPVDKILSELEDIIVIHCFKKVV